MKAVLGLKSLIWMRLSLFSLAIYAGLAYSHTIIYWLLYLLIALVEIYDYTVLRNRSLIARISFVLAIVYLLIFAFLFILL